MFPCEPRLHFKLVQVPPKKNQVNRKWFIKLKRINFGSGGDGCNDLVGDEEDLVSPDQFYNPMIKEDDDTNGPK